MKQEKFHGREVEHLGIAKEFDKKVRGTHFYKTLNLYLACTYAERTMEGENASSQEQIIAFQYLIDNGMVWSLQGWFGRTATSLIKKGVCEKAKK